MSERLHSALIIGLKMRSLLPLLAAGGRSGAMAEYNGAKLPLVRCLKGPRDTDKLLERNCLADKKLKSAGNPFLSMESGSLERARQTEELLLCCFGED